MIDDANQEDAQGVKGEADFAERAYFVNAVVDATKHVEDGQDESASAD